MKNIGQLLTKSSSLLATILLLGTTAVLPFAVSPLGDNLLIDTKVALFLVLALLIAAIWTVSCFVKKSLQLTLSPFFLPLSIFAGGVLVSSFATTQFPIQHLLGVGGIYLAAIVLVILGASLLHKRSSVTFLNILLIPALVISLCTFAELANFGPSHFFGQILKAEFPHSPVFSLAGSPLFAAQFLGVTLAGVLGFFLRKKKNAVALAYIIPALTIAAAALVNIQTVIKLQQTSPQFLPYTASYFIAIDTLKSAKAAIIGVGPEYFLHSYLHFKPVWLNQTSLWGSTFSQGSSFPFTILVTLGLVGLLSWLALGVIAVRTALKAHQDALPAALVFLATFVLQLLLPVNILLLAVQALALIFWIAAEKGTMKDVQLHAFTVDIIQSGEDVQRVPKHSNAMVYLIVALSTGLIAISGYWLGRATLAQFFMFRANYAAAQNDWVGSYDNQKNAIMFQGFNDAYHRKYALTNIAIASAISSNKDATDDDKQKISILIQQAVREAKAAAALDEENTANWLTLANVYTNLIGVVEGAENWTASAYTKVIELAPTDPSAPLELGGLLFRNKQYAEAAQLFEKAAMLKPDWSNAHYNLANAYKQLKQYEKAAQEYQQTLAILSTTGSPEDLKKVQAELDEVMKMIPAPAKETKNSGAQEPAVKPTPANTATSSAKPKQMLTATDSAAPAVTR